MKTKLIFVNGFDRSGSSAIVNILKPIQGVEIFMQPFNSSGVRRKMYKIWDDTIPDESDWQCFRDLASFKIPREYFVSTWFKESSTGHEFIPGHVHVLKTTINHFLVGWTKINFPNIYQFSIWRDPLDILASTLRNNVYEKWYSDALEQVTQTVLSEEILRVRFSGFLKDLNSIPRIIAFLISVRSFFLYFHIPPADCINYEIFKREPSKALRKTIGAHLSLSEDLDHRALSDLNLWGHSYSPDSTYRDLIPSVDIGIISEMFKNLDWYKDTLEWD